MIPVGADLPGEIWKPVIGHEQYVEVSNMGRLRTTPRLVGSEANNGYLNACLSGKVMGHGNVRCRRRNKHTFNVPIHRIVAIMFIGMPASPKQTDVNHIDGNKLNNAASNLEYCTRSENIKHAYAIGLMKKQGKRKLTDDDYRKIRSLYKTGDYTHETLAVKFGVSSTHIGYVLWRSPRKV